MVTIVYEVRGAPGTVYLKKNDIKPIEGIKNGMGLIFIDDMPAGAMLFDEDEKCWWDREGNKWTS